MGEQGEHPAAAFVERFADAMVVAGVPRMPSRVLARLTAADDGRLTAAELAKDLHASPAAISGAVRYLEQVDLVRRTRERGARRDHVVLHDDVWYHNIVGRLNVVSLWASVMRDGADAVGHDTPAGRRLLESSEFFEFLYDEVPRVMDRWRRHRSLPRAERDRPPPARTSRARRDR